MNYEEFLNQVVDTGIAAARRDYAGPDQKQGLDVALHLPDGLAEVGSVAGFEVCRGKSPTQLKELLDAAATSVANVDREDDRENYWWYRCYQAEVEWVCNVVSVMLMNQGCPVIITPTCRGVETAATILGVEAHGNKGDAGP